jgi:protein subunit release factor A
MEIPNEILVVPLKEKKPLIKNKRRALKILATLLSLCALTVSLTQ